MAIRTCLVALQEDAAKKSHATRREVGTPSGWGNRRLKSVPDIGPAILGEDLPPIVIKRCAQHMLLRPERA